MILDTMTKSEVMRSLRKEFDNEVYPYFEKRIPKYKASLRAKAQRKKGTITSPWEEVTTKNRTVFKYKVFSSAIGYEVYFKTQFLWNKRRCFACFYPNGVVLVFSNHCLERYAERVLGKPEMIAEDVFNRYLFKKGNAFHIVLPTPKHEFTVYHGVENALFLGDFDPNFVDNEIDDAWLNTCISLNETHQTQEGILKTLSFMDKFVEDFGDNPLSGEKSADKADKKAATDESFKNSLCDFYCKSYMLVQLHLHYNFPFTAALLPNYEERMKMIESRLAKYSISTSSLSPFGKKNGIAIEGEIDFKGAD